MEYFLLSGSLTLSIIIMYVVVHSTFHLLHFPSFILSFSPFHLGKCDKLGAFTTYPLPLTFFLSIYIGGLQWAMDPFTGLYSTDRERDRHGAVGLSNYLKCHF